MPYGMLVDGLEGLANDGFLIKLAANAEELEATRLLIDKIIVNVIEAKVGLERAAEKVAASHRSGD